MGHSVLDHLHEMEREPLFACSSFLLPFFVSHHVEGWKLTAGVPFFWYIPAMVP
jgi:hypothetical protein